MCGVALDARLVGWCGPGIEIRNVDSGSAHTGQDQGKGLVSEFSLLVPHGRKDDRLLNASFRRLTLLIKMEKRKESFSH